jgi:cold shock CspA family protein
MKHVGTIQSFDTISGEGSIRPETGGSDLPFERNTFPWDGLFNAHRVGQRISYRLRRKNGHARAVEVTRTFSVVA